MATGEPRRGGFGHQGEGMLVFGLLAAYVGTVAMFARERGVGLALVYGLAGPAVLIGALFVFVMIVAWLDRRNRAR